MQIQLLETLIIEDVAYKSSAYLITAAAYNLATCGKREMDERHPQTKQNAQKLRRRAVLGQESGLNMSLMYRQRSWDIN